MLPLLPVAFGLTYNEGIQLIRTRALYPGNTAVIVLLLLTGGAALVLFVVRKNGCVVMMGL